ncbi:hypothetical bacteriophage protein [Escherichia coli TA280]|nr:hypothetical bacteriophage protein [Escherichia coli TA280]
MLFGSGSTSIRVLWNTGMDSRPSLRTTNPSSGTRTGRSNTRTLPPDPLLVCAGWARWAFGIREPDIDYPVTIIEAEGFLNLVSASAVVLNQPFGLFFSAGVMLEPVWFECVKTPLIVTRCFLRHNNPHDASLSDPTVFSYGVLLSPLTVSATSPRTNTAAQYHAILRGTQCVRHYAEGAPLIPSPFVSRQLFYYQANYPSQQPLRHQSGEQLHIHAPSMRDFSYRISSWIVTFKINLSDKRNITT